VIVLPNTSCHCWGVDRYAALLREEIKDAAARRPVRELEEAQAAREKNIPAERPLGLGAGRADSKVTR